MSAALVFSEVKADIAEQPEVDVCATCEQEWPVEDLGRDANGDVQCGDCRSVDWSAEDAAAYRSYVGR
jgi:hypothetical protein